MQNIKKITALETYSVRHPVLRNGKPLTSCQFDGDDLETTHHFGYFLKNELIGVISLFQQNNETFTANNQYQIRGMAVLKQHQKKGFGEALVLFCESYCKTLNTSLIWFNARIVAVGFYEKTGYQKTGPPFEITGVGEHLVMFKKIKNK